MYVANRAIVQEIGDWGHDSVGESIDDDVLRDFLTSSPLV